MMPWPSVPRSWLRAVWWTAAAALGIRMSVWLAHSVGQPSHGFVSHYAASRLVLEGRDVARFYDDAWFRSQVARFEPTVIDLYGANLPTTSLLLLPLAPLDYHSARTLWTTLTNSSRTMSVIDTTTTNGTHRFYRAVAR